MCKLAEPLRHGGFGGVKEIFLDGFPLIDNH